MDQDLLRPKCVVSIVAEVLPETKHHIELKSKRQEEEKRHMDEQLKQKKEKEAMEEQLARASEAERQKEEAENKKRAEDEKRKKELQEVQDKLEGRTQIIKKKIKDNESPYEYSFTDVNIDSSSLLMLCECLKVNSTLMILHIARKKLNDEDGEEIAKMLLVNKRLEKVDLEGNQFGVRSAKSFALVIKTNRTLRYLDLEGNCLCSGGDNTGFIEMIVALRENIKLIGLNISNNNIDDVSANHIIQSLDINLYIIDLDITFNYGIKTEQVLEIMSRINRNKKKYDLDRLSEWKERKQIKDELDGMTYLMHQDEEYKKKMLAAKLNEIARQEKREADLKRQIEEFEKQKSIMLSQLEENAAKRKKKPRKRKAPGKKKN